jgi:excisionase family DNA binding protein
LSDAYAERSAKTTPELPQWEPQLTIELIAERLHVPRQTIYWWRSQGTFPAGKLVGRHVLVPEREFMEWWASQPSAA